MIKNASKSDIGKEVFYILPKDIQEDGGAYVYNQGEISEVTDDFVFVRSAGGNKLGHACFREWLYWPEDCDYRPRESKVYPKSKEDQNHG